MQMKTIKNTKYAQESTKFNGKQGERRPIVITRQERTAAQPKRKEKKECRGRHSFDSLGFVVLCPEGETAKAGEGYHAGYGVTDPAVLLRQTEALGSDKDIRGADHSHEQCRDKGDEIA